jgi:CHASE2 domain-containing sensor protein
MARLNTRLKENFRSAAIGAGLATVLGWCLWYFPLGERLAYWSYDLPFIFGPRGGSDDLIIIQMDDPSFKDLRQEYGQVWSRKLHAELLDVLRDAKLVVFDAVFTEPGVEEENKLLAEAIRTHGRVVLAADLAPLSHERMLNAVQVQMPQPEFLGATTNWGLSRVTNDTDLVIRQHYNGTELYPSLPWVAAVMYSPELAVAIDRLEQRWFRYYGPAGTLESLSYYMAARSKRPEYFADKIVFIGGKPSLGTPGEQVDEFRTPYTRWDGQRSAGVEIEATAFLNLIRGDWLRHLSNTKELVLILACGLMFGFGLCLFRPLTSGGLAIGGALVVGLFALILFWQQRTWFSWMVIVGAQIPAAWAWSLLAQSWKLAQEKTALERKVATAQAFKSSEQPTLWVPPAGVSGEVSIPDHALVRRIGKGSYGEVWLACNAIGIYRAVKIVRLDRFPDAVPYEREFKGMQKFMPISLSHPGMVHLLHVGRNEQAGYFYYIMELGDDQASGQKIAPETYSARNLAKDLQKRRRLPLEECVSLSLTLTDTLEYLHQQRLVHRDIKPSNIIFVNHVPKFADIGLVTDLSGEGKDATYIGTEGYIPPEGPGSPQADLYSLGKVIYEAGMGRDRRQFPELPDSIVEQGDTIDFFELNRIILKACEPDSRKRYQSAAEMHGDFVRLQRRLMSGKPA